MSVGARIMIVDPVSHEFCNEKEDIIKRIVSLEMNRLIDYYEDAQDIETVSGKLSVDRKDRKGYDRGERGDRRSSPSRTAEKGYSRLFINIGRTDGINPATLMGFINDFVGNKVRIGRIDLLPNFSFFEVPERDATKVIGALKNQDYNGRRVSVEISQAKEERRTGGGGRRNASSSRSGDNYAKGKRSYKR